MAPRVWSVAEQQGRSVWSVAEQQGHNAGLSTSPRRGQTEHERCVNVKHGLSQRGRKFQSNAALVFDLRWPSIADVENPPVRPFYIYQVLVWCAARASGRLGYSEASRPDVTRSIALPCRVIRLPLFLSTPSACGAPSTPFHVTDGPRPVLRSTEASQMQCKRRVTFVKGPSNARCPWSRVRL